MCSAREQQRAGAERRLELALLGPPGSPVPRAAGHLAPGDRKRFFICLLSLSLSPAGVTLLLPCLAASWRHKGSRALSGLWEETAGDGDKGDSTPVIRALMAQVPFRSPVPAVALGQEQRPAATPTRAHTLALPASSFVFLGESHNSLSFGFLIQKIEKCWPVHRVDVKKAGVKEGNFFKAASY